MTILATYATTTGERELVLIRMPEERPRFVLIDAESHVPLSDSDPRVVEDDLQSEVEARALAADYVRRAALAGAPATAYMPWDALDLSGEAASLSLAE